MDKTEKLILCVRQHRCLYDIGDKAYKNFTKKCILWEHIAKELDDTVEGVKLKWKNIRDGYTKYKKLRNQTNPTEKKQKYHNWVWGPQLRFLDDAVQPRPRIKNLVPKRIKPDSQNIPEASTSNFLEQTSSSAVLEAMLLNPVVSIEPEQEHNNMEQECTEQYDTDNNNLEMQKDNPNKNIPDQSQNVSDARVEVKTRQRKTKRNDAIFHLFCSYAKTFKTFGPETQANLKIQLAQLFYEAEIRDLSSYSEHESPT